MQAWQGSFHFGQGHVLVGSILPHPPVSWFSMLHSGILLLVCRSGYGADNARAWQGGAVREAHWANWRPGRGDGRLCQRDGLCFALTCSTIIVLMYLTTFLPSQPCICTCNQTAGCADVLQGLFLVEGHWDRFFPATQAVRAAVKRGLIGKYVPACHVLVNPCRQLWACPPTCLHPQ
jgi:hypothetical protein